MPYLNTLVRWIGALRRRRDDPLSQPMGRTTDGAIDAALAARGLTRADLFGPDGCLAPHRHRIAAMLARRGLSADQVVARYWPELKLADHACAHCIDKRRCTQWLDGRRPDDAPKRFCPNAMTFDRWRRDSKTRGRAGDRPDLEDILEVGLDHARAALKRIRPQPGPRSNRH